MEKIGIATIIYDEQGKVLTAKFEPKESFDVMGVNQFRQIGDITDKNNIHNAELVLANWFQRQNEIELADRNAYKVTTEVIALDRYPDGKVRKCVVAFYFSKI